MLYLPQLLESVLAPFVLEWRNELGALGHHPQPPFLFKFDAQDPYEPHRRHLGKFPQPLFDAICKLSGLPVDFFVAGW